MAANPHRDPWFSGAVPLDQQVEVVKNALSGFDSERISPSADTGDAYRYANEFADMLGRLATSLKFAASRAHLDRIDADDQRGCPIPYAALSA